MRHDPTTGDLLNIDVEAEIRKLATQRFPSAGDWLVEAVRQAAIIGPASIHVSISAFRATVGHDGDGLPGIALKLMAAALDPRRADADRHRALVRLERDHGLGLLAPFAVPRARVIVEGVVDGRPRGLEFRPGLPPRAVECRADEGFSITVRGPGRRPALERRLLRRACRYSMRPIFLDGERINRGLVLDDCLLRIDLLNPRLRGVVGLPASCDLVRIFRLRHGILVEEVVRAPVNGMVFHAVVDERDDDLGATWNTLRRAVRKLYGKLSRRLTETSGDARSRAVRLLLERFSHTREADLLLGAPLFPRLGGLAALDLESLRRLAANERIHALAPEQSSRGFDVRGRTVLRLDGHERRFLERELSLSISAPPRRAPALGSGPIAALRERWRSLERRFGGKAGRPVADKVLTPAELRFIEIMRAEVRSGAFSLADDIDNPFHLGLRFARDQRLPLVRVDRDDGRTEFRVARGHPLVDACVDAADDDPSWIYPALSMLADGRDGYGDGRDQAQQAILSRHRVG